MLELSQYFSGFLASRLLFKIMMWPISDSAFAASWEGTFPSPQQSFNIVHLLPDVLIIKEQLFPSMDSSFIRSWWKEGATSTAGLVFHL